MAKAKLYRYSDGETHTDNLTLKQAKDFRKLQNGGRITPMSILRFEDHPWTDSHLAACGPCMLVRDKQLPHGEEERGPEHDTHTPGGSISLADIDDATLARMIRESCYTQRTTFGTKRGDSRFLLVLAVPYGPDEVDTLEEAMEAFAELLQADDWRERNFQVYDHETGGFSQCSRESLGGDDNG